MPSLKSHYTALSILDKVLEGSVPIDENTLFFTTGDLHVNKDGEEVWREVFFFFGIGSDVYTVTLYDDGGEVQRLDVVEAWTVFPPDSNDEEEEATDVEED